MPLNLLMHSLKRVNVASGSSQPEISQPHPLHALLDPLLHTPRSAANKYNVELPQILSDGGGAGEIEEAMMWYVLGYEKGDKEYETIRDTSADRDVWEDERWRKNWLQRMERREVQIQILLHLLVLSLPRPPPPRSQSLELSSVKRRKLPRKKPTQVPTTADRLEAFMDKLSTWQLMGDLNSSPARNANKFHKEEELDWMQLFYKDTVEPQFNSILPESCELLRSKIFPNSPFTDTEDEDEISRPKSSDQVTRSSSPGAPPPPKRVRTDSITSVTRHPSPALSTTSSRKSSSRPPEPRKLERTRSLSASLREEELERRRAQSVGHSSRRVLNREISMSRSFKAKAQPTTSQSQTAVKTPVEPKPATVKPESKDEGITLVEATPVKPKEARVKTLSKSFSQTQAQLQLAPSDSPTTSKRTISRVVSQTSTVVEEEEWQLPGSNSPSVLLMDGGSDTSELTDIEDDDDDDVLLGACKKVHSALLSTPTKGGGKRAIPIS
uniref:DNA replication regulator Sld3 C-terminal domain-containing protein n=1 Tax=Moniliophthora roreri TaxID=221103 RepID=A0A0W0FPN7_MONRR